MHQLMPDLVFDGVDSVDHRRTYIAYRMMSEGISLVLADMTFVASLERSGAAPGYDWGKRRIFPLYQALPPARREDLRWLCHQLVRFVLLGDGGALATHGEAWARFCEKYSRFFSADFQWTRMNWANVAARAAMVRRWVELVRPETFRAQGLWFISEVVQRVGRGLHVEALVERLFALAWAERIAPALSAQSPERPDLELSTARGFRRWLTGQLAFFAQYEPLLGWPPLAHELAARVQQDAPLGPAERDGIRAKLRAHLEVLAKEGVLSDDDAAMYPECFPLFDPFFLRDYDEAAQEFSTVREASARAFAP
jgi:hypothetical protein